MPYYPVPTEKNYKLYDAYANEAAKYKKLYLLGRLANYKYINMDIAVYNAMKLFEKIVSDAGSIEIPAGFEGYVYLPYSSGYPSLLRNIDNFD